MLNIKKISLLLLSSIMSLGIFLPFLKGVPEGGGIFPKPVFALEERLEIKNIRIILEDKNAIITWDTNFPTLGRVEYGFDANYGFSLEEGNQKKLNHIIALINLLPERTYHYRISVRSTLQETSTFDAIFKTKKFTSNVAPTITQVSSAYITGTTATIQWITDKPATTEVSYGAEASYGSRVSSGAKTTVHDITIRGLKIAGLYHYQVKSTDADGNVSVYTDQVFKTNMNGDAENLDLEITNIRPITQNDENIYDTKAIITWKTNKLTDGIVRFGITEKLGKSFRETAPRDFFHDVLLTGLKPATLYYFQVESKDVFGKKSFSPVVSFMTRAPEFGEPPDTTARENDTSGIVLGTERVPEEKDLSCEEIDYSSQFGFYGRYYNLTADVPGVGPRNRKNFSKDRVAQDTGWYSSQYYSKSQIDRSLDFGKFFPLNEGKKDDPFYFAVNWRAVLFAPETLSYSYTVKSDDDSWIFIDGKLVTDLGGTHSAKSQQETAALDQGYHFIDIYFAERLKNSSYFSFVPDSRLKFYPYPPGCNFEDAVSRITARAESPVPTLTPSPVTSKGKVLGAANIQSYTQISALYRAQGSPDVYAIMNGKRHYISGPTALFDYGFSFADVKTVSRELLNTYPYARLLRTPEDPTVYFIYHRPDKKWMKIAIPTPNVFVSYPQNFWGDILFVHPNDIRAFPDVKLAKSPDADSIYLLLGDTKRPFASRNSLVNQGFHLTEIADISPEHLNYFKQGELIN